MNRIVEGSYVRVDDALRAVERLRDQGYSKNSITLIANESVRNSIPYTMDAEVTTDTDMRDNVHDDDRSLWEKIKDAFTMDDDYDVNRYDDPEYNTDDDPLFEYRSDIEQGNILVLIDEDASRNTTVDTTLTDDTRATDPLLTEDMDVDVNAADPLLTEDVDMDPTVPAPPLDDDYLTDENEETIRLREERLDVDTQEVQTGEVRLGKHVTEETETIDVPVTHEEVIVERHPVRDSHSTDETITDIDGTEEVVIPVTEEQVNVQKHTDVVEEIDVRKEKVTEQKKVSDTVRKEELDIDSSGDVRIEDEDEDLNRPL